MYSQEFDAIIVGSGPAGVQAAKELSKSNLKILMIDPSNEPESKIHDLSKEDSFEKIRRNYDQQHSLFLGKDWSALPVEDSAKALSWLVRGKNSYVTRDTENHLPLNTNMIHAIESLSSGGLAAAWGASCTFFSSPILQEMGLDEEAVKASYHQLCQEIGISGPKCEYNVQPPVMLDQHMQRLKDKATQKASKLENHGFHFAQSHLALLTQNLNGRSACQYTDMQHFLDPGESVYRPQQELPHLDRLNNFSRLKRHIAVRYREEKHHISLCVRSLDSGIETHIKTKKILLAAGAIGSARVALQSLNAEKRIQAEQPFLAKKHDVFACIVPSMIGKVSSLEKQSLCQALLIQDSGPLNQRAAAQLYSYSSFQLFRLCANMPLAMPNAMRTLRWLAPSMLIADLRYSEANAHKNLLQWDQASHSLTITGPKRIDSAHELESQKALKKSLRSLGAFPVSKVSPLPASPTHHAGSLPQHSGLQSETNYLFTRDDGSLCNSSRVHAVDASTFKMMPAGSPTLTIMANAKVQAKKIAEQLLDESIRLSSNTVPVSS